MDQLLQAESEDDLHTQLAVLDITVAGRSQGRTKEQTERFSMVHLLSSLPAGAFAFPLTVIHGDRPDFVLQSAGQFIGVELTEAVPENMARASVLRQGGLGAKVYFQRRATPGESPRSTAVLRNEIEMDSRTPGWRGREPEREWANAMLHFAKIKVNKAHTPGFKLHPENWLLIYDNWPLPAIDHAEAVAIFADQSLEADVFATFGRIFVLDSKVLCEAGRTTRLHDVRNPLAGTQRSSSLAD